MSNYVKPKKHLAQHFLTDTSVAEKIAGHVLPTAEQAVEVGPGTGILTGPLLEKFGNKLTAFDVDTESIAFLHERWPSHQNQIQFQDFLKTDLSSFGTDKLAIVGNFPYNISSQIVFHAVDYHETVQEVTGMFQREMAQRIVAKEGSKTYGVISVLTQVFYTGKYLLDVPPELFDPPPKVHSGVIQLLRRERPLVEDFKPFKAFVKMAFSQRRKKLRNSVKGMLPDGFDADWLYQRPEQLSVEELIAAHEQIKKR